MRTLIIRPAAEDDLAEAVAWYEQRQNGLGKTFLTAVDQSLERLVADSTFGIVVHTKMRRANIRRFPYGIFYMTEPERIVVVAVLHGRRAPRRWKSRIE